MNRSRCPHCGVKLGNFLYADECPHCHQELEYDTKNWIEAPVNTARMEEAWPIRWFLMAVRFVES